MEIWFFVSYGSKCYLSKLSVLSVLFLSVLRWLAEILSVLCFQFLWHHLFAYNDQARIVISVLFGISGLVFYVLSLIVCIIRACTSGFQYLYDNSSLVCNIYMIIFSLIWLYVCCFQNISWCYIIMRNWKEIWAKSFNILFFSVSLNIR